jgi:hypothetical protein
MPKQHDHADLPWQKASASGNQGCVEVAPMRDGGVAVRDSKNTGGPVLRFSRVEWAAFLDGMGKGEFDHLM